MVLYTLQPVEFSGEGDEYWKLPDQTRHNMTALKKKLRKGNYKFSSSVKRARLVQIATRCSLELFSYEGCLADELKRFCLQRNLQPPDTPKPNRADFATILEAADEVAEFPHFMDLPPELRLNIYAFYFGSLPTLEQPAQPPISKVSRITRVESLPVFYQTCVFVLDRESTWMSSLTSNKQSFWDDVPEEHLKLIRHLSIYLSPMNHWLNWDHGKVSFDMIRAEWPWVSNQACQLGRKLAQFLENIEEGPKGKNLTRTDIYRLMQLMW